MNSKRSSLALNAAIAVALAVVAGATVASAQVRVIAANPLDRGLTQIVEQYKKDTGNDIKLQIGTTADLNRFLTTPDAGDVFIGTSAMVDQALTDRKLEGAKTLAGRVGIGVVIRRGASVPNVATADAIKQAVLSADAVIYNTAGSGQYVQRMFDQMGVADRVTPKAARPGNAAQTMERISSGKGNEIGFGLLSEVKPYEDKGVQLVGKLPADLQNYTNYDAVLFTGTKAAAAARDFIRYLSTPSARQLFASTGVD